MRQTLIASTLILAAISLGSALGRAEPQLPTLRPPPPPPIKPYAAVPVTPPTNVNDAGFVAFRKQLADVAAHKDRGALAGLIVAHDFFWVQDKDLADKRKPGVDNLAKAIGLDAKDGSGWATLAGYAGDPTGEPLPDHPAIVCAPAEPSIDTKAFEALIKATQSEPPEWGYPAKSGIEVRAAAKPDAAVVDKLGLTLVRVLPDNEPPDDPKQPAFLHIATPSGKAGYVPVEAISSLANDQMCYTKEAGGWKIAGYFGGAGQ
jgi:CBS domain-containing protein